MKVIFLDNDGVICLANNWGGRRKKQEKWGGRKLSMTSKEIPLEYRFDDFDKKAIKVLNKRWLYFGVPKIMLMATMPLKPIALIH